MPAQSFQCPSCGAPLLPRGNASVIRCPHCHTTVVVPEELRQDSQAEQWTTLVFDHFASNDNNWLIGNKSDEYFAPLDQVGCHNKPGLQSVHRLAEGLSGRGFPPDCQWQAHCRQQDR